MCYISDRIQTWGHLMIYPNLATRYNTGVDPQKNLEKRDNDSVNSIVCEYSE